MMTTLMMMMMVVVVVNAWPRPHSSVPQASVEPHRRVTAGDQHTEDQTNERDVLLSEAIHDSVAERDVQVFISTPKSTVKTGAALRGARAPSPSGRQAPCRRIQEIVKIYMNWTEFE